VLATTERELAEIENGRETPLFAAFIYKMIIILPRQARDKHRERHSKQGWRFLRSLPAAALDRHDAGETKLDKTIMTWLLAPPQPPQPTGKNYQLTDTLSAVTGDPAAEFSALAVRKTPLDTTDDLFAKTGSGQT
jgi:hypothetical protein